MRVLTEQKKVLVDVPCSGREARAYEHTPVLHHLQDCEVKQEGTKVKIGSFEWTGEFKAICGASKLKMYPDMRLSFIGNTTNGMLSPFEQYDKEKSTRSKVCYIMRGSHSGPALIELKRSKQYEGFAYGVFMLFVCVVWASACLLYPDSDVATCREQTRHPPDQFLRIFGVGTICSAVSCLWALLFYNLGKTGHYIAIALIVVLLVLGFSEGFFENIKQWSERMAAPNVAADEETPLLPNPTEEAPRQQEIPPAEAHVTQTPPIAHAIPTAYRPTTYEAQRQKSLEELEGCAQVSAAVFVGVLCGTIIGTLLSLGLTYVLD
jgi:hypothetical protein